METTITLCGTGRTGLGHLRRITNIAQALHERRPSVPLQLLTNASPEGLTKTEVALYRNIRVVPRAEMATHLVGSRGGPVVVDTAVLPGLHEVDAPLCLILRETLLTKLERFRLEGARRWDLIIVPHPIEEWRPQAGVIPAKRLEAVGWIYRQPSVASQSSHNIPPGRKTVTRRTVLIASGGGGSGDTWAAFRKTVEQLIRRLRALTDLPLDFVQAVGPRASIDARIPGVDRSISPGPRLHEVFTKMDLVISTVGYNSVLELACTDVPALLVPIPRTYDDQEKRAKRWGPRLGLSHCMDHSSSSAHWIAMTLRARQRRQPIDVGCSGAVASAKLIEGLLG